MAVKIDSRPISNGDYLRVICKKCKVRFCYHKSTDKCIHLNTGDSNYVRNVNISGPTRNINTILQFLGLRRFESEDLLQMLYILVYTHLDCYTISKEFEYLPRLYDRDFELDEE